MDRFVAALSAPNTEPPVEDRRRCAGVPALGASRSSGHLHPIASADRARAAGRADPRRALRSGHVGSRPIDETDGEARQFAQRVVRLALEVLDHRRPVAHLNTMADASVVSAVRTLVRGGFAPGRALGVAVLTRVDLVMVNDGAAELFAAYDRGQRHFALAARITRTRRAGWRLTAIRVR
jgi:hypothetical protein